MQIKDIDKIAVLRRIAEIEASGRSGTLFQGFDNSINTSMPEGTPEKLQYAVMRNLISKGLVDGCCCGCRGDFVLTEKGVELVSTTEYKAAQEITSGK
ncbi:hypothetical protein [Klebsiella quasipneumoniae]|uniref:hypothetical protein n=1 Tax=Klebsiella quasipneumoniae TaxID=1463165 RepID=UPI0011B5B7B0|nr:hypothetical protein [Klebsiella quasipneumoniae]TWV20001.1 hypothetical protein FRA07_25465 [Klebsiella quasipneumoniae subsp. similipneumoniae]